MPDITELLDGAAPDAGGPPPIDAIVRRGRRRRAASRAVVAGVPLAAVAILAAVVLTDGSPTGIVIDPPPMLETPSQAPSEPAPEAPASEAPSADTADEATVPTDGGAIEVAQLDAELLLVPPTDGSQPIVRRLRPDGTVDELPLDAGVPGPVGLVPDRSGGFFWQPDWQSAAPAPILHMGTDGEVRMLAQSEGDATVRLVGYDGGLGGALITRSTGDSIDDTTADLLSLPADGGEPTVIREGVAAWESGVTHAAALETVLYSRYVEAYEFALVDPPDGEPTTVFEGGELTGESVEGIAISEPENLGVILVGASGGPADEGRARLLLVDLSTGRITAESPVPLQLGITSETVATSVVAREVTVSDRYFVINRYGADGWLTPLVHDRRGDAWFELERNGEPVVGRAVLSPAGVVRDEGAAAACATEDAGLLNAAPGTGDDLYLYVPCKEAPQGGDVHRLPADVESAGDVEADLQALLEVLIQPVIDEDLANRGYYFPADRGQPVLRSVTVGPDGAAVVDFGFPDGVGNLSTSYAGAMWHQSLLGTVFQFDQIETVEFRLEGSCEDYATAFEGAGCRTFARTDAPWNREGA